MTQAELGRHVRALVTSLQKSGLTVTGAKVTFLQGSPVIEVSTAESVTTAPVQSGGDHVEALKQRMRGCHERRA